MKPATNCQLTGLERMETDCKVCLLPILFLKYNTDGQERRAPIYHNGACFELGRIMKATKLLKRQQRRKDKRAQTEISFI